MFAQSTVKYWRLIIIHKNFVGSNRRQGRIVTVECSQVKYERMIAGYYSRPSRI